jgi:CRP-like cAMP-binding protein
MVTLETFADSGINYALRFFITDATERERIEGLVRTRLWHAFARSGISFPFPVRVLEQRTTVDPATALRAAAEERVRALSAVDFLTPLGSEALERLAHQISMAVFAPGETVVKEGEPGSTMFVVESGELRVLLGEAEVASLGRGAFFGEMSLLTGEPRRASVRAATGCRLFVIDHDSFKSVLSQNPEVARAISEKVAERAAISARKSDAAGPAVPVSSTDLFERIRRFFGKR